MVTTLDRLPRSAVDFAYIAAQQENKKVGLVLLDQSIDTTNPTGRLLFHMIGAIGEFERDLINERTQESRESAKSIGSQMRAQACLGENGQTEDRCYGARV